MNHKLSEMFKWWHFVRKSCIFSPFMAFGVTETLWFIVLLAPVTLLFKVSTLGENVVRALMNYCTILSKSLEPHLILYLMLGKWEISAVIYWNMFAHTWKHRMWAKNRVYTNLRSMKVNICYDHLHSSAQSKLSQQCLRQFSCNFFK